jgi:hypothetical protein
MEMVKATESLGMYFPVRSFICPQSGKAVEYLNAFTALPAAARNTTAPRVRVLRTSMRLC